MSDMETTNSLRVISLVLNTGSRLLREIFMKQIPAGDRIDVFLRNKRPALDQLRVLTPPQYKLVTAPSPDVLKFDITLLVALLRNICNISPPTKGWKQDPPDPTDLSLAADLLRFKGFRNRIAHSPAARLATADFEAKWQEVATILQRLATHANVTENIDALKTMPLDPTTNWYLCLQEQLSSIQEQNTEQAEAVRLRDANVDTRLSAIHDIIAPLGLEMRGVKANTAGLSVQINEQAPSLSTIQGSVAELGQEMKGVKANTTGLSEQIAEQAPSLSAIKDMVAELGLEIHGVKANTTGLSEQWSMSGRQGEEILAAVNRIQADLTRVLAADEEPAQVPNLLNPEVPGTSSGRTEQSSSAARLCDDVSVQSPSDKKTCDINALRVLADGQILVADKNNESNIEQADAVRLRDANVEKRLSAIHDMVAELRLEMQGVKANTTGISEQITEQSTSLSAIQYRVDELGQDMQGVKNNTTGLSEQIDEQSTAIHDMVAELEQDIQGVKANTTGLSEQPKPKKPPPPTAAPAPKQAPELPDKAPVADQKPEIKEEKPVNQALSIPTKKPVHARHPPPPIGKKPHKPAEPPKTADTSHTTKTTEEEKHKPPEEKPVNQAPSIPTKKPVHASHPPPPIGKKPHKPAEPPKPADTSHTTKTTEEEKRKPPEEKPVNQAPSIPTKKPVHASHPPPPIGKKPHKPAEPPKPADTSHTTKTTEEEKYKPPGGVQPSQNQPITVFGGVNVSDGSIQSSRQSSSIPVLTMDVHGTMPTASGRTEQSSSAARPCDDVSVGDLVTNAHLCDISVQSPSDKEPCHITAIQVLADGRVLLVDRRNKAVKLLSGDGSLLSELSLQSRSWDMALVRGDEAVVTMPYNNTLEIISITDRLTGRRTIKTDVDCAGIAVSGDNLITGSIYTGEIVMRDMDGRRIRTIWTSASADIRCVNINPDNDRLYVTDPDTVTCVTLAGDVLGQYKVGNLSYPRGMAIHPDGTIYVCGSDSNNIHHITAECTAISVILGNGEVEWPQAVGIDSRAGKLYVSEYDENKLKVFKLID